MTRERRTGKELKKKKKEKVTRRSMSPHSPCHSTNSGIQLSAKFTFDGRSVPECTSDACANRRVDGVESCCSMLSPAWHLICPQWMFSMSSFPHRLYALPSSRTTFAQQFQRVSFTFFFFTLYVIKKKKLSCLLGENIWGGRMENWNGNFENIAKIIVLFKSWSSWLKLG